MLISLHGVTRIETHSEMVTDENDGREYMVQHLRIEKKRHSGMHVVNVNLFCPEPIEIVAVEAEGQTDDD